MKFRALIVSAAALLALAGCAPEPVLPSPSPSETVATPSPTALPTPTPTGSMLTIPDDCDILVPLEVIHEKFSDSFQSIYFAADLGGEDAQSFAARNGLTCQWGIPQSDAGFVNVFVAKRGPATDELQTSRWRGDGYQECQSDLDACFFEDVQEETGEVWTVHVLADGFELYVAATSTSMTPLLDVAEEAVRNMGSS